MLQRTLKLGLGSQDSKGVRTAKGRILPRTSSWYKKVTRNIQTHGSQALRFDAALVDDDDGTGGGGGVVTDDDVTASALSQVRGGGGGAQVECLGLEHNAALAGWRPSRGQERWTKGTTTLSLICKNLFLYLYLHNMYINN